MEALMNKQGDNINPKLEDGINPETGEIVFEGVTYKTKAELCRAYGVKPATFAVRERRKYTLSECVYGRTKEILYDIDGKKYTLKQLSDMSGGEYENTIYSRIRGGMSPKDAISPDYEVFRKRGIENPLTIVFEYEGKKLSATDIEKEYGVPKRTVLARYRAGWDTFRIINEPVRKINRKQDEEE